jgi:parallel beta-helix repeat protein
MKKKCLAVGIILLFAGTCIIPSTAYNIEKSSQSASNGNWLYVGGSGPGNYTRIQDAIDNASDGDTVYVYSGMYSDYIEENLACVRINKSISLIGQDKATTVINGSGHHDTVRIEESKITLSGFTVRTDGDPDFIRIGITMYYPSQDIDINDMIISQNYYGIVLGSFTDVYQLRNISIYENTIVENKYGIENVRSHSNIQIHHNTISQNEYGIEAGHNYTISENHISNNTVGISEAAGDINVIHHNDIRHNEIGIKIFNFRDANISENNFINNKIHTSLSRKGLLSERKVIRTATQNWINNYWDNWNKLRPKPIIGFTILYIMVWLGVFRPFPFPIAILPYFEFDRTPAQEPYDIPGMR